MGDIASAKVALRDWPAVRDCNVIGMRAGDRSGVASSAGELTAGAGELTVGAGELTVGARGPEAGSLEVGKTPVVAGAVEAGALATGSMTPRPASTAAREARRARETGR